MNNSNRIIGKLNWWYDADTIRVIIKDSTQSVIRLSCIDGLEKGQRGFEESISFLTQRFPPGIEVELLYLGRDNWAYRREVCHAWVWMKGIKVFLNLYLVQVGWACCYPEYFSPCQSMRAAFHQAQEKARTQRKGMWVYDPMPPWEWRELQKN